ncbi:MAG TPA: pseudouridine synthase [Rhodothermales bacterium]|nr:pseudouridine synthase [Rhodothermales bacterium]
MAQDRKSRGRNARRPRQPSEQAPPAPGPEGTRLNRYLAQAGVCSRRNADELIAEGRVRVNGDTVTDFSTRIKSGDRVEVAGRVVSPQDLTYILLNKPPDTITTRSDEKGRQTVMEVMDLPEEEKASLFPVGRLDRNTVGVLLLTNDGDLAHRLMHPRYNVEKIYVARTKDPVKPHQLEMLLTGIQLDDGLARADRVSYTAPPDHHEIAILLHEGRNRQIRRMLEALGHEVASLERVKYAGIGTEGVRRGKWRRLAPYEVKRLRQLVKLS